MLQKVVTIASIAVLSFAVVSPVFAGESSNPQYSGTTSNVIVTIDKKVANPKSEIKTTTTKGGTTETVSEEITKLEYLDNITASDTDKRFAPTQKIVFKLTVKNTSDQTVKNVVVSDKLPLDTVANISSEGSFDSTSKTISITIPELKANESRDYYITGTIVTADRLPSEQPVICSVNQSYVSVEGATIDEDNAAFCIEKAVGTVTKGGQIVHEAPKKAVKTPATGPEMLTLIPLIGSGLAGFALRRKAL